MKNIPRHKLLKEIMLQYSRAELFLLLVIQLIDLYQMQMPADVGIELYVCVCVGQSSKLD